MGSAVLRHGNRDWDVIASELRIRTMYPVSFTPQACKAKYEDLRQRYSGCTTWFEELKKRRVEELKLELEKSEGSIGSLESRLKRLKAENENYCQVDYDTSQTESPAPIPKTEVNESSGKETSKDTLSVGSFTLDFKSNWSPECRIPELASAPEMETKPKVLESDEQEKLVSIKVAELRNEKGSTVRKRRGKRKRKDCNWEVREGSIGESDNFGATNVLTTSCKETSTGGCVQTVKPSGLDGHNEEHFKGPSDDLMGIFNFVAESKHALGFRRRLDSQKRARYKRIIRQHMDLDTIRSRIGSSSIKSTKELFRDLLLLANNAMVFYSKRTREYKSALSLRDFVTKEYHQHCKDSLDKASSSIICLSPICNLPVKPRSFRPRPSKSKFSVKPNDAASGIAGTLLGNKRVGDAGSSTPSHSLQSSGMAKKSSGAPQGYLKLRNADSSTTLLGSLVMAKKRTGIPHGCKKLNNVNSNLLKQSMVMAKNVFSHPGKVGYGTANHLSKTPIMKERKKQDKR